MMEWAQGPANQDHPSHWPSAVWLPRLMTNDQPLINLFPPGFSQMFSWAMIRESHDSQESLYLHLMAIGHGIRHSCFLFSRAFWGSGIRWFRRTETKAKERKKSYASIADLAVWSSANNFFSCSPHFCTVWLVWLVCSSSVWGTKLARYRSHGTTVSDPGKGWKTLTPLF